MPSGRVRGGECPLQLFSKNPFLPRRCFSAMSLQMTRSLRYAGAVGLILSDHSFLRQQAVGQSAAPVIRVTVDSSPGDTRVIPGFAGHAYGLQPRTSSPSKTRQAAE